MRRFWLAVVASVLIGVLTFAVAGELLSRPASRIISEPPSSLHAESVRIPLSASQSIAGGLVRGRPGHGAVLLLHGVRSNRIQMLGRAQFLQAAGYSVLLVDLPAHGESSGDHITFGAREAVGVSSALAFLRNEFPGERTGVIGVSLGAAAFALSRPEAALNAVVLEFMYPTIREAVANRFAIRFGSLGAHLSPLLLYQLPFRLGVTEVKAD